MINVSESDEANSDSYSRLISISFGALIITPSRVFRNTEKGISEFTCILFVGKFNTKIISSGRCVSSVPISIFWNVVFPLRVAVIVVFPDLSPVTIGKETYS